jgi:hypothetical protein
MTADCAGIVSGDMLEHPSTETPHRKNHNGGSPCNLLKLSRGKRCYASRSVQLLARWRLQRRAQRNSPMDRRWMRPQP